MAVPWTRRTGGAAAVGLPPGQVNAAARVAAFTEKGASPAKAYVGAALFATGAAAAAGAYLGNRMADGGHEGAANNLGTSSAAGFGAGATPPANAGSDYFASRSDATNEAGPDYFSGNDSANNSDNFFSNDASYDDTSSGDTGGGGFDSTNDDNNSGSW